MSMPMNFVFKTGMKSNCDTLFLIDIYKAFHKFAYHPRTEEIYSNWIFRNGKYSNVPNEGKVTHAGAQVFVMNLMYRWEEFFNADIEDLVHDYQMVLGSVLGVAPQDIHVDHIRDLHALGYLPLEIKALVEGTLVPYQIPTMSIRNTIAKDGKSYFWLTNMLETVWSNEYWPISTSATTATSYMRMFMSWVIEHGVPAGFVPYIAHDFSMRGMMGTDAATLSNLGHMLAGFNGTDTLPGVLAAMKYYGQLVGNSVNATEHSTECSWIKDGVGEQEGLKYQLTEVCPTGNLSKVCDTLNLWRYIEEYAAELKPYIMEREGKLVFRPDSGIPELIICGYHIYDITTDAEFNVVREEGVTDVEFLNELIDYLNCDAADGDDDMELVAELYFECEVLLYKGVYYKLTNHIDPIIEENIISRAEAVGVYQLLWEIFGGTEVSHTNPLTNETKKLKLLDEHVGCIYGDSITHQRAKDIGDRLLKKGFIPLMVFGIGSFTYQMVSRDTHGGAVKATHALYNDGTSEDLCKDPITDPGKKSAKGYLYVGMNQDGTYYREDSVTFEKEQHFDNLLRPIFLDGKMLVVDNIGNISNHIMGQLVNEFVDKHTAANPLTNWCEARQILDELFYDAKRENKSFSIINENAM